MLELIKITFLLEPLLLFSSLDHLRFKSEDIEQVYRFVGEVDSIISVASLRSGIAEYCIPAISGDVSKVRFKDIRHPLIPDCVPNDVDFEKSILLTGSNMSGKTTYIRAIGLNVISGMMLNTCFAKSAIIPIANLFSVIRIEDDLINSSSYFFKEADEVKKIIQQTGPNNCSIVLLDELFKGTNTIERIASAKAILSYLSKRKGQVFVSTHDLELTRLLKDEFELVYFSEYVSNETIHFDYTLKSGVPEKGNAIRILEMNGYPKEIIREARSQLTGMG
ncbi:DNA mismatch repair protein MutS [compost metagenome]